jgi:hypothetical protein
MAAKQSQPGVSALARNRAEAAPHIKSPLLTGGETVRPLYKGRKNNRLNAVSSGPRRKPGKLVNALSSVRLRLMGAVFLLVTPAALLLYVLNLQLGEFTIGLLALVAAWVGGEFFVMRQVRRLIEATRLLQEGNLATRTGLSEEHGRDGLCAPAT